MNAYIRKVFPHDLTHEISVTVSIVNDFFENQNDMKFYRDGDQQAYTVTINNATDPRFGGQIRQVCGELAENDYIVIVKKDARNYQLSVVRQGDDGYGLCSGLFVGARDRHSIVISDDEGAQESLELKNENTDDDENSEKKDFSQIIYYGVPGSGKSFEIEEQIKRIIPQKKEREWRVSRVVFHPDYTNADFVGQILPIVIPGEHVSYKFVPGPFSKILRRAYLNPHKNFYLIIEEINRGNASAIFGDLFQLLDRTKPGRVPEEPGFGENEYGEGWSNYSIENQNICDYIRDKNAFESETDGETENNLHKSGIETAEALLAGATSYSSMKIPLANGRFFVISQNTQIRLPPNLSLYATMNTSDQNVFTLDNAFQRRWEMKQVTNKLDLKQLDKNGNPGPQQIQYNQCVGKTGVKWGEFRDEINRIIMESAEENGLSSMEDKRLGGWFIIPKKATKDALPTITESAFAEKVLKYLWDEAFKFDRRDHFGDVKTLEELVDKFHTHWFKVFENRAKKIADLQIAVPPALRTTLNTPVDPT